MHLICKFIYTNLNICLMKKTLLILFLTFISVGSIWSQCAPTCSNYAVSDISVTPYPNTGTNAIPMFTPNGDDGYTPPVPIGFSFNYYCTTYTSVLIYTNGLIQFDIGAPSTFPSGYDAAQFIPNPSLPTILNGIIAFRMDDLDPSVGGTVTYATLGSSPNQSFVVTYSNVPLFGNSSLLYTGHIVLHETSNEIDIISINSPQSTNFATMGIENATGSLGTSVLAGAAPTQTLLNQAYWGQTNTAYRFIPVTPAPPTAISGSTMLCEGETGSYQATFMIGATSYNWSLPAGWGGTSTISALTALAGTSGNLSVTATYTCGTSATTTLSITTIPAPTVGFTSVTPLGYICSGKTVTFNTTGGVSYTLNPGAISSSVPTITDTPLITTIYTLTGTSPLGCVSVNNPTVTIPVNETPVVSVNSGSICLGEVFTITPSGANSYVIVGLPFGTTSPAIAGQYTYPVIGTATNGCVSDTAFSNLTAYALPNVGASAQRTVMCTKENVKLTATGADTYLWSNGSANATITVSPPTNTFYIVTGTDLQGCKNTETVNLTVKPCTGLNELSGGVAEVKVFPNPTNGVFEIHLNSFNETTSVEIYNALGQRILVEKVNSEIMTINLKEFNSGLYYVKIKNSEQQSQLIKVIKQ
jgi:hypothetical protein